MGKFSTDWICIGQSGPTVDGREIEKSWLTDAAETYDPARYTALLWPDHLKYQNYGKVLALRAEEGDGTVRLFARVQPNSWYLWENSYGQKLFFSMEIMPDFAKSGRAYLVALAVTDLPASLGTQELHFSQRRTCPESLFVPGVECGGEVFSQSDNEEMPGWFKRYFGQFFSQKPNEDNMNKEQFDEIIGKFTALEARIAAFCENRENEPESVSESASDPLANDAGSSAEEFQTKVENALAGLEKQLDEMNRRFEQTRNGTQTPEHTGAAGEITPVI